MTFGRGGRWSLPDRGLTMKTFEIWYVPARSNFSRQVAFVEATCYTTAIMKFELKHQGSFREIITCRCAG